MNLFPAIDLYQNRAVRLLRGDYAQMTVYSEDPVSLARDIEQKGAAFLHVVDLEGAKTGNTPALPLIKEILAATGLRVEIGGGIRSLETVKACLDAGAYRVILGTKAVTDPAFLDEALAGYGERIAVGVDARNGKVAIDGWTRTLEVSAEEFLEELRDRGVRCAIVTDISSDGVLKGPNLSIYRSLTQRLSGKGSGSFELIASGGVSSLDDLRALKEIPVQGAILGKAMYTGAVRLEEALALCGKEDES